MKEKKMTESKEAKKEKQPIICFSISRYFFIILSFLSGKE